MNGFVPCVKFPGSSSSSSSDEVTAGSSSSKAKREGLLNRLFSWLGPQLTKPVIKATVIVAAVACLGFGAWGNVLLRQEFDPMWFLPKDSYLARWAAMNDK